MPDIAAPRVPSPHATLTEALLAGARQDRDAWLMRLARQDGSFQDTTRGEFLSMCLRAARFCRDSGLAPGQRALICLENSPAWGAVYFGVLLAGGVAVPVDAQSPPEDIAYFIGKTRARLAFAQPGGNFPASVPDHCRVVSGTADALAGEPLDPARAHHPQPGNLAAIIFTSGTTGRPKGVMLTHANLMANLESIRLTGLLKPTDNFLAVLPLHHAYPCMVNLLVPVLLGARTTFVDTLKPEAILHALKAAGVSILVLTPQYVGVFHRRILSRFEALPLRLGGLVARLLASTRTLRPDPLGFARRAIRRAIGPDFRFFLTGGARCEAEVIDGMAALGVQVLEGYGLSETAPVISLNRPEEFASGSVGRPLDGVEVRIDDPGEDGVGEIVVRGPNVTPGYFEEPAATAAALQGGWLRTGDQGRVDSLGRIFVRGRERDVIVLPSGKKFSAEEVEAHYRQAPSIAEICVMAGPGGEVRAVVAPDQHFARTTDSPDIRANVRWDIEVLSKSLPAYKRVRHFAVVAGELPKTRLGKIKRHLAEKMFEQGQAPATGEQDWPDVGEAGAETARIVREHLGLASLNPSAHLELDLGLDSLGRLELAQRLEDELSLDLPEESLQRAATALELARLAQEAAVLQGGERTAGPSARDEVKAPLEFGPLNRLAADAAWLAVAAVARACFRLRVLGQDNIPDGAAIIAPNHASFLDGFMVFAAVPRRHRMRLYFMGLARFFEAPVVRRLAARCRLIAVDAGKVGEAMRLSARVLSAGRLLCAFPEGSRSPSGRLQRFRKGPVQLSAALGVPVVPTAISGTYEAWPVGGSIRPGRVTVSFGRPVMPATPEELREAVAREVESLGGGK